MSWAVCGGRRGIQSPGSASWRPETTPGIVLAGEDVDHLFASPTVVDTIADRLRPGPQETQRCELDVSTAPLTFTDWARGAAVVSLQHSLGAL